MNGYEEIITGIRNGTLDAINFENITIKPFDSLTDPKIVTFPPTAGLKWDTYYKTSVLDNGFMVALDKMHVLTMHTDHYRIWNLKTGRYNVIRTGSYSSPISRSVYPVGKDFLLACHKDHGGRNVVRLYNWRNQSVVYEIKKNIYISSCNKFGKNQFGILKHENTLVKGSRTKRDKLVFRTFDILTGHETQAYDIFVEKWAGKQQPQLQLIAWTTYGDHVAFVLKSTSNPRTKRSTREGKNSHHLYVWDLKHKKVELCHTINVEDHVTWKTLTFNFIETIFGKCLIAPGAIIELEAGLKIHSISEPGADESYQWRQAYISPTRKLILPVLNRHTRVMTVNKKSKTVEFLKSTSAIDIWDLNSDVCMKRVPTGASHFCEVSDDLLMDVNGDGVVTFWDTREGKLLKKIGGKRLYGVNATCTLPGNTFVILLGDQLNVWDLSTRDLTLESVREIVRELIVTNNKSVRSILFRNMQLGDALAVEIATLIECNNSLLTIDLSRNGITDKGAIHLINALKRNTTLTTLKLNGNRIRDDLLKSIQNALNQRQSHRRRPDRPNVPVDRCKNTALHRACKSGTLEEVNHCLHDLKIDPNAQNTIGDTPLHIVSRYRQSSILADALIRAGADLNRTNKQYKTPLEVVSNPMLVEKRPFVEHLLRMRNKFAISWVTEVITEGVDRYVGDYAHRDLDRKLLDELASHLTGVNVQTLMRKHRLVYLGHLNSLKGTFTEGGSVEGDTTTKFEGFFPDEFLPLRSRVLLELIIKIEQGLIREGEYPISKAEAISKFTLALCTALETLRAHRDYLYVSLKSPWQGAKNAIIDNLQMHLRNLHEGEFYQYCSGFRRHTIYISFERHPKTPGDDDIRIRIDNLGGGVRDHHEIAKKRTKWGDDGSLKVDCALPYAVGIVSSLLNSSRVRYVENIIKANGENRDVGLKNIYDLDNHLTPVKRVYDRVELEKRYSWRRWQTVGNCTVKNHQVGLQILLQAGNADDSFYRWFREIEAAHVPTKYYFSSAAAKVFRYRRFERSSPDMSPSEDKDADHMELIVEEAVQEQYYTPLHLAVVANELLAVQKSLIKGGADVHAKTKDGYTCFHLAVLYGYMSVVDYLLSYAEEQGETKKLLDDATEAGETALHLAAQQGDSDHRIIIERLLEAGADTKILDREGLKPLDLAHNNMTADLLKAPEIDKVIDPGSGKGQARQIALNVHDRRLHRLESENRKLRMEVEELRNMFLRFTFANTSEGSKSEWVSIRDGGGTKHPFLLTDTAETLSDYGISQFDQTKWTKSISHHHDNVFEKSSLKKGISIEGLIYQPLPGDGHCLFHAVALYLGEDQKTLRQLVSLHIEIHLDEFRDFISLPSNKTIQDYIEDIRNGVEWADDLEINVLMRVLDRPIVTVDEKYIIRNKDSVESFSGKEPIFVFYDGRAHYDALLLSGEKSSNEILNGLLCGKEKKNIESTGISTSEGDCKITALIGSKLSEADDDAPVVNDFLNSGHGAQSIEARIAVFQSSVNAIINEYRDEFTMHIADRTIHIALPAMDDPRYKTPIVATKELLQETLEEFKGYLATALGSQGLSYEVTGNRLVITAVSPEKANAVETFLRAANCWFENVAKAEEGASKTNVSI